MARTRQADAVQLEDLYEAEKPLPYGPTNALPGSEYKIQVMCERAALGQQLFHPQDATFYQRPGQVGQEQGPATHRLK